jgi:hypothetical protein
MRVKTIDGIEYNLSASSGETRNNASSYHLKALSIIKELYPAASVSEEITIKTFKNKTAYIDIFLPAFKVAVEVHGPQHYTFNKFFHQNKREYIAAKIRDSEKAEWCYINGFKFVELKYDEPDDEWNRRIRTAIESAIR